MKKEEIELLRTLNAILGLTISFLGAISVYFILRWMLSPLSLIFFPVFFILFFVSTGALVYGLSEFFDKSGILKVKK